MKKTLLLIASVALTMAACTNDVAEPNYGDFVKPGEVAFTATSVGTRTSMTPNANGGLDIAWVGGEDQIGIFASDETAPISANAAYTAVESGSYTAFQAEETAIQWGTGVHSFYAYYPYVEASDLHQSAVPASIPDVQEQAAAGDLAHIEPLAFMYASKEASKGGVVDFSFVNAFSVLEVKLCAAEGTVACDAVIFRATDESEAVVASNIYVNLADGSLDYSSAEAVNQVTVSFAEAIELNTDTPASVYAMITPGHAGKTFQAIAVVGGKEVVLGEMAVPESGIPAGVKAVLSLNVPAPAAEAIDLSAAGTANCYIVNQANTEYKFNATVKGNGATALAGETATLAPAKAAVLWSFTAITDKNPKADGGGWPDNLGNTNATTHLIDKTTVELREDGYIYFKTQPEILNGNVIIAATDAAGNIVWSWHMWILEGYEAAANDHYVTASDLNIYMMDRNIGATASPDRVASPTQDEWTQARGFYYQWGRKDPFMGSCKVVSGYAPKIVYNTPEGVDSVGYAQYGSSKLLNSISVQDIPGSTDVYTSVAYAVANPRTYIMGNGDGSYSWVWPNASVDAPGTTSEWGKLWGNQTGAGAWDKGGVKTMYDPCPVGYRVPSAGHFRFITSHGDNAGAYYNKMAEWKYNCVEKLFDENGEALNASNNVAPFGLNFYVKGSKTAAEVAEGAQNYGIAPEDKTTTFFPAQGCINWGYSDKTYKTVDVTAHTNQVREPDFYGYSTLFMKATRNGEFFNNTNSASYAEQQAKALPVRCVREDAVVTPEPEPEPEVPAGIDLSADGSANCYVVNAAGTKYKFKATVKGNGYDPLTGEAATAIDLTGANAYIFWGYKKTTSDGADNTQLNASILRESVKIEGDYITFETPAEMLDGNVGIAVADADGNIMWSWHMWCIQGYDYKASAVDVTAHDMNFKIMDRNMGAFSNPAAIENPTDDDFAYATGLLYQWGRKDPFLCGGTQYSNGTWFDFIKNGELVKSPTFSIKGDAAFKYNDFIAGHGLSDFAEILPLSIKNPLQFFVSSNHWVSASDNDNSNGQTTDWGKIWGNQKAEFGGTKTMYDPCPVGYTVASPAHMKFITSTGNDISTSWPTWQLNATTDLVQDADVPFKSAPWGLFFYTKGVRTESAHPEDKTVVFLPKHRWVDNTGKIQDDKSICFYSNAPSPNATRGGKPYKTRVDYKGKVTLTTESWTSASQAASALAVRCVSENK